MIRSQNASVGKNAVSPSKLRVPVAKRASTTTSAVPPLPAIAEIATITCTMTNGKVTCVDSSGEPLVGSKLANLQAILKPIADAPTLSDTTKQVDASLKTPEAAKPVEAKPVSDTLAAPKAEAKAQPAAVVADKKPEAPVAKPAVSDATTPVATPAVSAEPKAAAAPKASVVTESKPSTEAPPVAQTISGDAKPPAAVQPKPSAPVEAVQPPAPVVAQNISGDAKPPAPTQPKPSAPVEAAKPPAPIQATSSGTPTPQSTPSTPDAAVPPPNSSPSEAATTNVSSTTPSVPASTLNLKSPKDSGPVTLATSDLAPRSSSNELRPRSVARGNDDSISFSTGTSAAAAGGNSTLGFDAPVSSATTPLSRSAMMPGGRFPGNVDPADFLPTEEFDNIVTTVTPLKNAAMTSATKPKTFNVMNEKGLIPGNLPPELGDILQLVNAVNSSPVKNLDVRMYPGNVAPDDVSGSGTPTVLEFSPGNSSGKGKDVQAVQMQLTPGNISPELSDMLDFFGIGPSSGA